MHLERTSGRFVLPFLAATLLVASCGGSTTDNGGGNGGGGPTQVQGAITHGGAGVTGVQITLREGPAADRMMTTGPNGTFVFENVAPGPWEILIEPPSYFQMTPGQAAVRPVTVVAQETSTVNATLLSLTAGPMENVGLGDATFSPPAASVTPGTVVRFTNASSLAHNVTPDGHTQWSARGLTTNGQTTDVTLNNPGTWNYVCTLHSGMTGTIQVVLP